MKPYWIATTACLVACSGAAEIPDTPDLTEIQDEYQHPTAVLDATTVNETLAEIPPLEDLALGFRATGYSTRGVDEAQDSAQGDSAVRIQGSIRVSIRCPGELDDPVYDANTNGTLSLTIGVEDSRIRRGIGGRATNCILRGDAIGIPIRVRVNGPFAIDLGNNIGLRDRWSGRILMLVSGEIDIGDLHLSNLSARWTSTKFEYLFRVPPDNNWIIAQLTEEGISIRDRDQTWVCPDGQPCGL